MYKDVVETYIDSECMSEIIPTIHLRYLGPQVKSLGLPSFPSCFSILANASKPVVRRVYPPPPRGPQNASRVHTWIAIFDMYSQSVQTEKHYITWSITFVWMHPYKNFSKFSVGIFSFLISMNFIQIYGMFLPNFTRISSEIYLTFTIFVKKLKNVYDLSSFMKIFQNCHPNLSEVCATFFQQFPL